MSKIVLKVNGIEFEGWKNVQVNQSLSMISGSFSFGGTDIFPGQSEKWKIRMGDTCTVEIEDQRVIDGYIEDINSFYDENNEGIQIKGRDITGDLVDCSYVGIPKVEPSFLDQAQEPYVPDVLRVDIGLPIQKPIEISILNSGPTSWKDLNVGNIIDRLIRPFLGDTGLIIDSSVASNVQNTEENFNISEGDKVFEVIAELCRKHAILPVSFGDGKLTLIKAGATQSNDSLERGRNIKRGSFPQSYKNRFSDIWVKGQDTAREGLDLFSIIGNNGQAQDKILLRNGTRNRPLIIVADHPLSNREALTRAQWEVATRIAESRPIKYIIQGWLKKDDNVWKLNELIRVKDSRFEIDDTLLISELEFGIDDKIGEVTGITVVPKEAYDLVAADKLAGKVKTNFDPSIAETGQGRQQLSIRPWNDGLELIQ